MTPKEKAEDLMQKYDFVYIANYTSKHEVKECAFIAVDEVLKVASFYNDSQAEVTYWQEVKQEIDKL